MDIKEERNLLIKRIEQVEDVSLIKALKHILDYASKSSDDRISIEQYNRELDEADAEIDRGEFISHEDFKKQLAKR